MQQSGGLLLVTGWTVTTPLFSSLLGRKCKSSPLVSTTKKESFVYQTKDSFFELSVPCGTISTPTVREVMLRIVKCLRT